MLVPPTRTLSSDRTMSGSKKSQLSRPEQRVPRTTLPYLGPALPYFGPRPPKKSSIKQKRGQVQKLLHSLKCKHVTLKMNHPKLIKGSQSGSDKVCRDLQIVESRYIEDISELVTPVGRNACPNTGSLRGPTDEHQVHAGTAQTTLRRVEETETRDTKRLLGYSTSRKRQTLMLDSLPPAGFMRGQIMSPRNPTTTFDAQCAEGRMTTSASAVASVRAALATFDKLRREYQCNGHLRPDQEAAKAMKLNRQRVYMEKFAGDHPGVEIGSEFKYRNELTVIGLHSCSQAGIDFISKTVNEGLSLAVSVVASGGYSDKDFGDTIIYSGEGGHHSLSAKGEPQDQKLERGNLALKNNVGSKTPVRVIKGKDVLGKGMVYTYCGLYNVESCDDHKENNKTVYTFKLVRQKQQEQQGESSRFAKLASPSLPKEIKLW